MVAHSYLKVNTVMAAVFVAGIVGLAIGVFAKLSGIAAIAAGFGTSAAVFILLPRTKGFLTDIQQKRSFEKSIPILILAIYLIQVVMLDIFLGDTPAWSWAWVIFDVVVGVFVVGIAVIARSMGKESIDYTTGHRRAGKREALPKVVLAVACFYVALICGKAVGILYESLSTQTRSLTIENEAYFNINVLTITVAFIIPNVWLIRSCVVPKGVELNEVERFLVYYETSVLIFDMADGLSLYAESEFITDTDNADGVGACASAALWVCIVATFIFFSSVVFKSKLSQATILGTNRDNWPALMHIYGAGAFIDGFLVIMRSYLWIYFKVPITGLFAKNCLGVMGMRSFGDYTVLADVGPLDVNNLNDRTRHAPPITYGGERAKVLYEKVTLREHQLRDHRECLIRYKEENDRLLLELNKKEKLLEMQTTLVESRDYPAPTYQDATLAGSVGTAPSYVNPVSSPVPQIQFIAPQTEVLASQPMEMGVGFSPATTAHRPQYQGYAGYHPTGVL